MAIACPLPHGAEAIDFQKNNFAALSVGDILQYNLLPAALRKARSKMKVWNYAYKGFNY